MADGKTLPSAERLLELIDGMAGRPVILVADLVADRFVSGTPKRISREAPVLILRHDSERFAPGGGANAVANVAALGGRPRPIGIVGDDASGHELRAAFERLGVDSGGVAVRPGYRTPTKTRILAGGAHSSKQQVVRLDVEDHLELSAAEEERLLAGLDGGHRDNGGVTVAVVSDYGYGSASPALARRLRAALGPRALLLCDSRYRLGEFGGIDGATPNLEEAEALLGAPLPDGGDGLDRAGAQLRERLGARFLLITRGSHGMSLFSREVVAHLPVHGTDQVADVTGAGDTVIGTFALALAAGATPLEASSLANYAGGVVVMKLGTATLAPEELRQAVRSDPRPLAELRWGS